MLVCLVVPWIIPAFAPFIVVFFFVRRRYLQASREVKRSDAISRSPLYSRMDSIFKVSSKHSTLLQVQNILGLCMLDACTQLGMLCQMVQVMSCIVRLSFVRPDEVSVCG